MHVTWFDNNSWLLELAGARILLDPWLVGDLVFGNAPWFYKATHPQPMPIPENLDLILLSQGLPDHAHAETLKALDPSLPVVGSPNAAKVARSLGFESVTALAHTEIFIWNERLKIQAFPGSLVGPQLVENAFVLEDLESRLSLYYEPHGNHSSTVKSVAPVDVVITPIVSLKLPVVGAFIQGGDRALELMEWLQPQTIVPTLTEGEADYEGILNRFISSSGSIEAFRDRLRQVLPETQVIVPDPRQRISIQLQARQQSLQV
jgi:L-ascorbate metabolism protein UlaG (beta-lactamase superfamily)